MSELLGKPVKIWLRESNFKFEGVYLGEDRGFVIILDHKTKRRTMLNRQDILQMELIEQNLSGVQP